MKVRYVFLYIFSFLFLSLVTFRASVWAAPEIDEEMRKAQAWDLGVDVVEQTVTAFTKILFSQGTYSFYDIIDGEPTHRFGENEQILLQNTEAHFVRTSVEALSSIRQMILDRSKEFKGADFASFSHGFNYSINKGQPRFSIPKLLGQPGELSVEQSFEALLDSGFLPKLEVLFREIWTKQQKFLAENGNPTKTELSNSNAIAALSYWPFAAYGPRIFERRVIRTRGGAMATLKGDYTFISQKRATHLAVSRRVAKALEKLELSTSEQCANLLDKNKK